MPNRSIRRWKAKGLTDRSAREMTFHNEENGGRDLSVAEYYQETYNIKYAPQSQEEIPASFTACLYHHAQIVRMRSLGAM